MNMPRKCEMCGRPRFRRKLYTPIGQTKALCPSCDEVLETYIDYGFPTMNGDRYHVAYIPKGNGGKRKLEIPDDGNVYEGAPREDADSDGMADAWEAAHGGNLKPNGHELDPVYDNIEVYLNELAADLMRDAEPVNAHQIVTGGG